MPLPSGLKKSISSHGLKFLNREEISELIAQSATYERQALLICTAVNLWAAGNAVTGEAKIPEDFENQERDNPPIFRRNRSRAGRTIEIKKGEKGLKKLIISLFHER